MHSHRRLTRPSRSRLTLALASLTLTTLAGCADRELPTAAPRAHRNDDSFPIISVWPVTNTADDGRRGSLRWAINQANSTSNASRITFSIPASDPGCSADGCTINLTPASSLPTLYNGAGVLIDGGTSTIVIKGDNTVILMIIVSGANVTVKHLTFRNGGSGPFIGGAIQNGGTLTVEQSTFLSNIASVGAAIANYGTLTVSNSTFSGNTAYGAGGAISHSAPTLLTITNSTFSGNSGLGSALYSNGPAAISFSTVTGGTSVSSPAVMNGTLNSSILVTITGSILSHNGGTNCRGLTDGGYNLEDGNTCGFSAANHSQSNTDPLLDPAGLQNNGGPTPTFALQPGSPAVDAIPNGSAGCGTTTVDQRFSPRPSGSACDIGAFELLQDNTAPVITPSIVGTAGSNGWYTSNVTVSWTVADAESPITSSPCAPTTISADTPGQVVSCVATSLGGTNSQSVTIKRDATAPTLSPSVSPSQVLLNGIANASPNASDDMSGLASSNCDAPNTTSVGNKSVGCTASDNAGNTATSSATYSVVYPFTEFLQPIDPMPTINVAKAGSSVPVVFGLGGDRGLVIFAAGYPASQQVSCSASAPQSELETTTSPGNSTLTYDATTQRYTYTWKTDKSWSGTCRTFTVMLVDGSSHQASFKFK